MAKAKSRKKRPKATPRAKAKREKLAKGKERQSRKPSRVPAKKGDRKKRSARVVPSEKSPRKRRVGVKTATRGNLSQKTRKGKKRFSEKTQPKKKKSKGRVRGNAPIVTKVVTPEGVEGIVPLSIGPEEARELIFTYLTDVDASLTGGTRVRTHVYKDDTVDGEIMMDVPRGTDVSDAIFQLGDAVEYKRLGPWFWVQAGARYMIYSDDDVIYRKFDGMNETHTYYQPMNASNIAEVLLILRTKVTTGMQRRFRRKASVIFLRIHFAPYGQRPERQ